MSSELDEVAKSLFNGQLPNIWRKLAPATLKSLGSWMEHFLQRFDQYNRWVRILVLLYRFFNVKLKVFSLLLAPFRCIYSFSLFQGERG